MTMSLCLSFCDITSQTDAWTPLLVLVFILDNVTFLGLGVWVWVWVCGGCIPSVTYFLFVFEVIISFSVRINVTLIGSNWSKIPMFTFFHFGGSNSGQNLKTFSNIYMDLFIFTSFVTSTKKAYVHFTKACTAIVPLSSIFIMTLYTCKGSFTVLRCFLQCIFVSIGFWKYISVHVHNISFYLQGMNGPNKLER